VTSVFGRCVLVFWLPLNLLACGGESVDGTAPDQGMEFVVVYSSIDEARMAPLYRAFTEETGIRIQQVTADDDKLLQLMLDKTQAPVADFYITDSAARLWRASDIGVLRPTHADDLNASIPAHLRDPENQWFGLAVKANVLVFNSTIATAEEFAGYESLANPAWRGQVCMSSSALPDNNALIALLIDRHQKRGQNHQAELIVRQLMANLALPVLSDSQALFAAIESGRCTVGIASLDASVQRQAAGPGSKLGIAAPTLANGGTQVDIVGAGVTRHAGNAAAAVRLLRWLAGHKAQETIADSLLALPVVPAVAAPQRLRVWQELQQSETNVAQFGLLHQDAIDLAARARYP
jgi:iron(III) transport system substrate-binding protein